MSEQEPISMGWAEDAFAKVRGEIEAERDEAIAERDRLRNAVHLYDNLCRQMINDGTIHDNYEEVVEDWVEAAVNARRDALLVLTPPNQGPPPAACQNHPA